MKKLIFPVLLFCTFLCFSQTVKATDVLMPKREMRSAWVATVYRLDWPQTVITSTGNTTQINKQKAELTVMLDSMARNNMNAINFQVRSRSDAMYKSSYEPWSTDLVSTRGMDPGYDPLEFAVEECHKRGMECHAWVNPYRYESSTGSWDGMAGDYRKEHPDWIMDYNGASILNPAKPEVLQLIVNVCKEIITNYDVDGILYDDYFYINGSPLSLDADLYQEYKDNGGILSQKDWRRDNVNRMVKAVYEMIQEVKPWVRFGVSPAGVSGTKANHAAQYGLEACPSGSDWQYDGIYSDPLAWISQKSLDFISPQIYWTIGYTTADYAKITPWWAMVANKFNRQFFTSHDISSLTSSSKSIEATDEYSIAGMSSLERTLMSQTRASGPNNNTFKEFADEIKLNRESTLNDAPGSIFYSVKYMYSVAPLFAHYLKTTVFSKPALMPAVTYKPGNNPGGVKNFARSGNSLSWTGYDNVRYTVYAVPTEKVANFNKDVEYLLGTTYGTTYDIPESYRTGYEYAVCVLDRYSNEYSPIFAGVPEKTLPAATLISPVNGGTYLDPFTFEWNKVEGATNYIVEVATDTEFKQLVATLPTTETTVSTQSVENWKANTPHYWRVRSCANNYQDGVSSYNMFIPQILAITSISNNATGVSQTPNIQWTSINDTPVLLEISTSANFESGSVVLSESSSTGSYQVGAYTLKAFATYYARVTMTNAGVSKVSNAIEFTTVSSTATVPVILYPEDGGKLYSEDMITLERQQGAESFKVQACDNTAFGRTSYLETLNNFAYQTKKAGEIKISSKNLVADQTYYLRALATYATTDGAVSTEYSNIISFVYGGPGSGVEGNLVGASTKIIGGTNPVLSIVAPNSSQVLAQIISSTGAVQANLFSGIAEGNIEIPLSDFAKGMYLIVVNVNGSTTTLKFIR